MMVPELLRRFYELLCALFSCRNSGILLFVIGSLYAREEERGSAPWRPHLWGWLRCHSCGRASRPWEVSPASSEPFQRVPSLGWLCSGGGLHGRRRVFPLPPGETACSFASAERTAFVFSQIPLFPWNLQRGTISFLARPGCISVGFRQSNASHPHGARVWGEFLLVQWQAVLVQLLLKRVHLEQMQPVTRKNTNFR